MFRKVGGGVLSRTNAMSSVIRASFSSTKCSTNALFARMRGEGIAIASRATISNQTNTTHSPTIGILSWLVASRTLDVLTAPMMSVLASVDLDTTPPLPAGSLHPTLHRKRMS